MAVRPLTIDQHTDIGSPRRARFRTRPARFVRFARAVFRRQPVATIIVVVFLGVGALAPVLAPDGPAAIHMRDRLDGPSRAHWLGTDEFGRDLLSRVIYGARIAFQAGVIAVGIAMIGGVFLGLIAGYFGGKVDYALSRLLEGLQAFPVVLLAIAMTAVLGPSVRHAMISIGIATIPDFARITRGVVLPTKVQSFVESARVIGCSDARILRTAILPNCLPAITVLLSYSVAHSILYESALSFLGLGAQPPQPSWGTMLSTAKSYMFDHPSYTLVVGLALSLTIIGLNLVGDAVREVLDPLLKR